MDTRRRLTEVTSELTKLDKTILQAKKEKEDARQRFFEIANEAIMDDNPYAKNPEEQPFSFANPQTGVVHSRIIAHVDVEIDTQRLHDEHPKLADDVLIPEVKYVFDSEAAQDIIIEKPETFDILKEYVGDGKLQPRLIKRKATAEDLDDGSGM